MDTCTSCTFTGIYIVGKLGTSRFGLAVVRQVHEYYAEFCAVNEDFFSANCPDTLQLALPRPPATAKTFLSRNRDAVLSVLLALKKKPSTIRYAVRETGTIAPAPIVPNTAEHYHSRQRCLATNTACHHRIPLSQSHGLTYLAHAVCPHIPVRYLGIVPSVSGGGCCVPKVRI